MLQVFTKLLLLERVVKRMSGKGNTGGDIIFLFVKEEGAAMGLTPVDRAYLEVVNILGKN